VADGTMLNVYQLLRAVNHQAVNGLPLGGDARLNGLAEDLLERLNEPNSSLPSFE
jgi:hypothetical protein